MSAASLCPVCGRIDVASLPEGARVRSRKHCAASLDPDSVHDTEECFRLGYGLQKASAEQLRAALVKATRCTRCHGTLVATCKVANSFDSEARDDAEGPCTNCELTGIEPGYEAEAAIAGATP
jgi:hypothetical protein